MDHISQDINALMPKPSAEQAMGIVNGIRVAQALVETIAECPDPHVMAELRHLMWCLRQEGAHPISPGPSVSTGDGIAGESAHYSA